MIRTTSLLVLALTSATLATDYDIVPLATHATPPGGYFPGAINDAGVAAFPYHPAGLLPRDVYTHDGVLDLAWETVDLQSHIGIDAVGRLAFIDWFGSAYRLVRLDGGGMTTIAETGGVYSLLPGDTIEMTSAGEVVFAALLSAGGAGIYLGDGTSTIDIALTGPAEPWITLDFAPDVVDSGMVVFYGTLNSPFGMEGIFCNDGSGYTTLQDETGPFRDFVPGPCINDNGTVMYHAQTDTFAWGLHAEGGGMPLTTLVEVADGFVNFGGISGSGFAMNDSGTFVFRARTTSATSGLYDGPDPVADKIIAQGDAFGGGVVHDVLFDRGLNNAGQVTFGMVIEMPDGTLFGGQYLANPVPAIPGDINGDGMVDVADLLVVIGAYGACPAPCPPSCDEDLNGDCVVDVSDVLVVLANWGP